MTILGHETNDGRAVLTLDTCMAPRSFAQSGLPRLLAEAGFRISPSLDVTETLSEGTFSSGDKDIEGERDRMKVFFPDFSGKSLLEIAEGAYDAPGERDQAWLALSRAFSTLFRLARAGGHGRLPLEAAARSGPESVLCGEDGSLFVLPPTLYRRCAANAGDDSEIGNRLTWIHPDPEAATPERALSFMAANLAYRLIAGKNAFGAREMSAEEKKEERPRFEALTNEMRKGRFERLYFVAPTLSEGLVNALDAALDLKREAETDDALLPFFENGAPLSSQVDPARTEASGTVAFARRKELHDTKLRNARKREAFLRRYRGLLYGAGIAVLIIGAITGVTINDMSRRPTTKGMEPDEVVDTFYRSVATLDQEWPATCLAKGVKPDYLAILTNIYVTTKVRESYERNGGVLSPALLFAHGKTDNRPVYGVSGLNIERDTPGKNEYTVSLYLWMPTSDDPVIMGEDPGDQLSILRYKDRLTLALVKDRWRIIALEPLERASIVPSASEILPKIADGSAAAEPWAPRPDEIDAAREEELKGITL